MRKFLICLVLALVFGSTVAESGQITKLILRGISYPIAQSVRHLQPRLSWQQARQHADIIYKEAKRSGINWKLILAIAHQESSLRWFKGDETCGFTRDFPNKYQCVYRSFGPMHVVFMFWKPWLKLDHRRLRDDLAYGYHMGVRILEIKRSQYGKTSDTWYSQYNAKSAEFRKQYVRVIQRRIKRINNFLARQ